MNIGDLRLLPKGTVVKSLALQEQITFSEDKVVEVTGLVNNNSNWFVGKLKLILFARPGQTPSVLDQANGDLGCMLIKNTLPFKLDDIWK